MSFMGQNTQPTVSKYWKKKLQRKNNWTQTTKYTYTYTIIDNKQQKDTIIKHNKSPSLH